MTPRPARRLRQLRHHLSGTDPVASTSPPVADGLPVTCTVDFDSTVAGTNWGHLEVPNPTIMASSLVPICMIRGENPGRTVLLVAGVHGNEYEGQVALRRIVADVQSAQLCGRLIIIPTISPDASAGWSREWPDGTNFNRVMPGSPRGIPAEQLAHFLSAVLIPRADIVYDLHTGGHNMRIQPSTMCFALADANPARHREEVLAQLAMNAPLMMLRRQPPMSREAGGMVWYEAKIQGKITIGTEWGGGGMCHPDDYESIFDGVKNSLRALQVLQDGLPVCKSDAQPVSTNYTTTTISKGALGSLRSNATDCWYERAATREDRGLSPTVIALHRSSQDYIVQHNGASPINPFPRSLPDYNHDELYRYGRAILRSLGR